MHPNSLTDILRQVPGGFGISPCVQYWVDDMPWQGVGPGDINNFVTGGEVVAVEAYKDFNTPGQYMRAGGGCTTIVLWTRFKIRS
jgi:hypothetical protein